VAGTLRCAVPATLNVSCESLAAVFCNKALVVLRFCHFMLVPRNPLPAHVASPRQVIRDRRKISAFFAMPTSFSLWKEMNN
jgi:hypothetical protein